MSTSVTRLVAGAALLLAFWVGCTGAAEVAGAPTPDEGALRSLTVGGTPDKVVVELTATRPIAGQLQTVGTPPTRLYVDLAHVVPEVPDATDVSLGAVQRVRVGLNRSAPPVTRVVLDVHGATRFAVEQGLTEHDLRITVETDIPQEVGTTDTYAAWFTRTSTALARLLAAAATSSTTSGVGDVDQAVVLEWDTMRHHLSAVTPPPALAVAHALLVTAGAVGHAAIAGPRSSFPPADVRAGAAGAAILVRQAEVLAAPHLADEPLIP